MALPSLPSSDPVLTELRRIADLLDARLPSSEPAVALKPGPAPIPLDAAEEKVFEALRSWRRDVARREGLSPYIVAYDRSLRQVARERPATVEALQQIPGFSANKAKKYGAEVLSVLAQT
jgi:superfamily II DNA helicase RecQ